MHPCTSFFLQLLAIFEHYYYRLVDVPIIVPIFLMLYSCEGSVEHNPSHTHFAPTYPSQCNQNTQQLMLLLILCIICDLATANTSYRYDYVTYKLTMFITYLIFIASNIGKILLVGWLLEHSFPYYFQMILAVIRIHSAVGLFVGLAVYSILRMTLSIEARDFYRRLRRMMEGIPNPFFKKKIQ